MSAPYPDGLVERLNAQELAAQRTFAATSALHEWNWSAGIA
ncbi:MAG: hypothetical protein WCA54_22965 [Pseudolabrys sp.]